MTFQAAVDKINALPHQPDFILHTGDLSHLAKASEFDTLDQLLKGMRQKQTFYVPGEHDLLGDEGKQYMERFGKGTMGRGWRSCSSVGLISGVGLDHQGKRASPRSAEALRLGNRAERAHPSGNAEGGRKRDVPFRDVNRFPATRTRKRAIPRTNEGARGEAPRRARHPQRQLRGRIAQPGSGRFGAERRVGRRAQHIQEERDSHAVQLDKSNTENNANDTYWRRLRNRGDRCFGQRPRARPRSFRKTMYRLPCARVL